MNKRRILTFAVALCTAIGAWQTQVNAEGPVLGGHDYFVNIKTQRFIDAQQDKGFELSLTPKQPREYFNYKGSDLSDVTMVRVEYRPGRGGAKTLPTGYEELWYSRGRPLGMERLHSLDLESDKGVAIRIRPFNPAKQMSETEAHAAANAALRVLIDLYENGNTMKVVQVADASFNAVSHAFQAQHLLESPDEELESGNEGAAFAFWLCSDNPDGASQKLFYPR